MNKWKKILGLAGIFAAVGLQQLELNRTYANNISVSDKNNVEVAHLNKKDEKTNVQYIDYENEDSFNKDTERLFQKVKAFLEGASNVSEADFDDYCREFIKSKDKIKSLSESEFNEVRNQNKHMLLYRGISNQENVTRQKQGVVYIGGPVRGAQYSELPVSVCGNGIHLTTSLNHANMYSIKSDFKEFSKSDLEVMNSASDMKKFLEENKSQIISEHVGENLMFLLPKDSKLVSSGYLNKLFDKMLEMHPDYFKSFIDFKNNDLLPILLVGSSYFKVLNEFLKEQAGFDYFNCGLSAKERANKFNELSHKFIYFSEEDLNNSEKFQIYKKFLIWMLDHVDEQKNSYLVDKTLMLSQNLGVLAKLMGYDGVYENGGAPGKIKESGEQFYLDEINVVNYDNLLVCDTGLQHDRQTIVFDHLSETNPVVANV